MTYSDPNDPRSLLDRYQIELNRRIDALRNGQLRDVESVPGLCAAITAQTASVVLALSEMRDERQVA